MIDKKYYMLVIPTVLVVGLLVGLVFSFQPAQANSTAPASVEANSAVAVCTLDTTGAISYWPLDETSGTSFTDTVGVVYNGSCSGDSCPSTITGTNNGGQFFFDTDSDAITAAGFTYDFTAAQDLSVGIWVKTTQNCDENKVFIGRYKNLNTDGRWWLGCVLGSTPGEGVAMFHMRDSDGVARVVTGSTTQINNGEWHYVVGVRDGSGDSNKLYVDGNLEATETSPTFTGNFTSSAPLTMGAYDEPTDYYFNGTLDEAAVYSTALSESFINTYITTNCSFPIDIRDVAFDTGKNIPIEITALELLDVSSGAGPLTITSVDSSSEKGSDNISYSTLAGPFTYTPPTDYVGSDFFTFEVSDGTNTARGTAIITQKNPVVTNPGPQADYEGALITPLQIVATDPQEETLTYEAANLPGGLSIIDPLTGIISGVVALDAFDIGPLYAVTVTVTDSAAHATVVDFTWTISANQVPVIAPPIGDRTNEEGDLVSLQVVASDGDFDTLTYGAADLPPGLTINSTGEISGTVSAGAVAGSPYPVTVTVSDGKAVPVEENFNWVITGPNRPPVVVSPVNQASLEGATVSLQVQAIDPDGDTLTFSATGLPPGLSINPSSGLIGGTITAGASTSSPYTVKVKATDPGLLSDEEQFIWTVALTNVPPQITQPANQVNSEGDPVSLQIVATDSDGSSLVYVAIGLPPGLSINVSTGLITGTILSGASTFSPYTVTVTVDDGIADPVPATFTWTVKATVSFIYLPLVTK